ncbi:MAG: hypothetical protein CMB79_12515 [Filomicrobium sp.]|nr:hypothetical protein [Filomicrobium sp.]
MKVTCCAINLPQSTSISDLAQTSFVADAPQIRVVVSLVVVVVHLPQRVCFGSGALAAHIGKFWYW